MCQSDDVSQQPPSQDPYGQQDPYAAQQGYSQPVYPGYPQYPQQQQPRKPLDVAKIVFIGAWVVLGLYAVNFFYILTQDEDGVDPDFADRFFGSMPQLAEGLFYTGLLLGLYVWLDFRQKQGQGS